MITYMHSLCLRIFWCMCALLLLPTLTTLDDDRFPNLTQIHDNSIMAAAAARLIYFFHQTFVVTKDNERRTKRCLNVRIVSTVIIKRIS
jgi:hypothetical protein